jgi:hypothetical protein
MGEYTHGKGNGYTQQSTQESRIKSLQETLHRLELSAAFIGTLTDTVALELLLLL